MNSARPRRGTLRLGTARESTRSAFGRTAGSLRRLGRSAPTPTARSGLPTLRWSRSRATQRCRERMRCGREPSEAAGRAVAECSPDQQRPPSPTPTGYQRPPPPADPPPASFGTMPCASSPLHSLASRSDRPRPSSRAEQIRRQRTQTPASCTSLRSPPRSRWTRGRTLPIRRAPYRCPPDPPRPQAYPPAPPGACPLESRTSCASTSTRPGAVLRRAASRAPRYLVQQKNKRASRNRFTNQVLKMFYLFYRAT